MNKINSSVHDNQPKQWSHVPTFIREWHINSPSLARSMKTTKLHVPSAVNPPVPHATRYIKASGPRTHSHTSTIHSKILDPSGKHTEETSWYGFPRPGQESAKQCRIDWAPTRRGEGLIRLETQRVDRQPSKRNPRCRTALYHDLWGQSGWRLPSVLQMSWRWL